MRNSKSSEGAARNAISVRMRRARLAFDPPLTQDELSGRLALKQLFLDRVAITKIENGQRCVFDFELKVLAEVLKVDVRWLLGIQTTGGPVTMRRPASGV
jgi:hypothetical protein